MKTFEQRMSAITEKVEAARAHRKARRIRAAVLSGVFVAALALVLFVPCRVATPDLSAYTANPYYAVIRSMELSSVEQPRWRNNYERLILSVQTAFAGVKDKIDGDIVYAPDGSMDGNGALNEGAQYWEVTDNQVEGVVEGDLFKRSDRYLYYLDGTVLRIYSIDGENTQLVTVFSVEPTDEMCYISSNQRQMFLSADCRSLIILFHYYTKDETTSVGIMQLDVSDPANGVSMTNFVRLCGNSFSARMIGSELLVTCVCPLAKNNIDYDDPETFIPSYTTAGETHLIEPENIVCFDDVSSNYYTVAARIDANTLQISDTVALLGYSQDIYVSADTLYATCSYTDTVTPELGTHLQSSMTRVTGISYAGDGLDILGTATLAGTVKDQYSLDQHNGILRIATTTRVRTVRQLLTDAIDGSASASTEINSSLYCVDLSDWQVVASVENFAPAGEGVTSVRFDGDNAYICTALIRELSDPVYFFDLSDLSDIVWTDTGTIDGFSDSLIDFGNYLLGIGYGDNWQLKLEAYAAGDDTVHSLGTYLRDASFPTEYKAYYIDRTGDRIGLPVFDWYEAAEGNVYYLLLQFDGSEFRELVKLPLSHYDGDRVRATVIDGWLYVLYSECIEVYPLSAA